MVFKFEKEYDDPTTSPDALIIFDSRGCNRKVTEAEKVTRYACSTCVKQMITYRHLSFLEVIRLSEKSFNTSLIIKAVWIGILCVSSISVQATQIEKLEARQVQILLG